MTTNHTSCMTMPDGTVLTFDPIAEVNRKRMEVAALQRINADLLAALESLLEHCAGTNYAFYVANKSSALREAFTGQKERMQSARTAIARARGE